MSKTIKVLVCFTLLLSLISCSRDKEIGVQTVLKGHVSDTIRGINISGYKIVLVKSWRECANWACGTKMEEVATAYTDANGDYAITFHYQLNPGESYSLLEQYYGTPYYPEYSAPTEIVAGKVNTVNINAWRPIELKLKVRVLNNNHPPLMIRNELAGSGQTLFNTENIYEQTIERTYSFRSRPDSDIKIVFWYYTGSNSFPVLHQKVIPYHTTLDDTVILDYTVDSATF